MYTALYSGRGFADHHTHKKSEPTRDARLTAGAIQRAIHLYSGRQLGWKGGRTIQLSLRIFMHRQCIKQIGSPLAPLICGYAVELLWKAWIRENGLSTEITKKMTFSAYLSNTYRVS